MIVVPADHGNTIVHCGSSAEQQLILLSHAGHYDVNTKLNAYFGVSFVYIVAKDKTAETFVIIDVPASNVTVANRSIARTYQACYNRGHQVDVWDHKCYIHPKLFTSFSSRSCTKKPWPPLRSSTGPNSSVCPFPGASSPLTA